MSKSPKPGIERSISDRRDHEIVTAIHIHSTFSDGSRPIPEIAEIAASVGLDALLFTDHLTLKPFKQGYERYYGPTLALIGFEMNDRNDENHYLIFGLEEALRFGMEAPEYVSEAHRRQGLGIIAHPDECRSAMPEYPPYPWTRWDVVGFDGIELWNHSSEWMEGLTPRNKYWRLLHPRSHLQGPPAQTLVRWDQFNRSRRVVGVGGPDAHAHRHKLGPATVEIFPYKVMFRAVRTHCMLERPLAPDVSTAKGQVYGALRAGRTFVSNRRWGEARGFRFWGSREEVSYEMGDRVQLSGYVDFQVRVPARGETRLLRDGEVIHTAFGRELFYSTDLPGVYRVEVRRRGRAWIYGNPIVLLRDV
jgi:hypothetical protein